MNQRSINVPSVGSLCPFCGRSHLDLSVYEQKRCRYTQQQILYHLDLCILFFRKYGQLKKKLNHSNSCAMSVSPRGPFDETLTKDSKVNQYNMQSKDCHSNLPAVPYSQWICLPVFLNDDSDIDLAEPIYHRVLHKEFDMHFPSSHLE